MPEDYYYYYTAGMIAKRWLDGGPTQHCCLVFPVMFTVNRVVSVFLQTAWLIMDGR